MPKSGFKVTMIQCVYKHHRHHLVCLLLLSSSTFPSHSFNGHHTAYKNKSDFKRCRE